MSQRRRVPLLLLYTNTWQWCGWNSADVITSVRSSMFAGLMSTISEKGLINGSTTVLNSGGLQNKGALLVQLHMMTVQTAQADPRSLKHKSLT